MISDRRRHERINVAGRVYYSLDDPKTYTDKHEAQIVDLSPCGICISTLHEFERDSKVDFYITEHYNGLFTGTVKRCIKSSDDKYHVGLEVPFSADALVH